MNNTIKNLTSKGKKIVVPILLSGIATPISFSALAADVRVDSNKASSAYARGWRDRVKPEVNITAPGNSDTVSGLVQITADASDNVGVTAVMFHANGNYIGKDSTPPYSVSVDSSRFENGRLEIGALATDRSGNIGLDSLVVTVENGGSGSDTTPPSVSFITPQSGALVDGITTAQVAASDDSGVENVTFFFKGEQILVDRQAPYSVAIDTTGYSNGAAAITAVATDTWNNTAVASVAVNVNNNGGGREDVPPELTILSPSEGDTLSGTVEIRADATDQSGVKSVYFYAGNTGLGFDSEPPYTFTLQTTRFPNGELEIGAIAADKWENVAQATVKTIVNNGGAQPEKNPPQASITSPADRTTVSGEIEITANIVDESPVEVYFLANGRRLGSVTEAPYTVKLDTKSIPNGSLFINATAIDKWGNMSNTMSTVTVSN